MALSWIDSLAWKLKRICCRADILKNTRSATKVSFKPPDLTEGIEIPSTARTTTIAVLGCYLTGFSEANGTVRAMLILA